MNAPALETERLILMRKEFWHKGIVTEAGKAVVELE